MRVVAPLPKKYIFALKNRIVNPVKEILVIDNENMKGEVIQSQTLTRINVHS